MMTMQDKKLNSKNQKILLLRRDIKKIRKSNNTSFAANKFVSKNTLTKFWNWIKDKFW